MFPINDNDWIAYIQAAEPNNVNPCWIDIVGDVASPAAYYYLYPTPNPNPTEVAFRMRLNGDPLSNNPAVYGLKDFVWGVEIRHSTNTVLFTILVNASGGSYTFQVRDSSSALIYNIPIALNNPSQPTDNVRVVDAGAQFPCASPMIPDEDYFLDFTLPTSIFTGLNFASSTYRLCYFTSTQNIIINKEFICGMIINPPVGTPVLCVTKQIISAPLPACTNETYSWVLLITIYNCGTVPVNNVVLTDTLNSSIVLTVPPVFIPNVGVSYNAGTRVVTWNIGTVNTGDTLAITINMTGYFTAPGHYILDSGTVNGTGLAQTIFADHGILVYAPNQLTVNKQIVSGPLSVETCKISTWTLSITIANTEITDIPNVVVIDEFNSSFTIESGPQLTPSAGYANVSDNQIIWTIDDLVGNSSETLLITVTGFFSGEGHRIFDTGSVLDQCMQTVTFQDTGIDVLPISIARPIKISGDILDCKTNQFLDDVSATVYEKNCKIIGIETFNQNYELALPAGTYTVLFEKEGYSRKFLSLVLQSDMDITADVNMAPKSVATFSRIGNTSNANLDMFSGIICEKIDAEIVYSSQICVNSEALVESLDDIVDGYSCSVVCNSKLHLMMNLEKNLVYK
ncbi:MAG: hypothetical protein VB055_03605 [Oscillospiraceae bacterium]|nr:hypothetical protein [Oscillospiraceae bacterium]